MTVKLELYSFSWLWWHCSSSFLTHRFKLGCLNLLNWTKTSIILSFSVLVWYMWYPIKFKASFYATFNGNPSIFVKSTRLVLIDLFMLNYFLFIKHVPDNIDIRPYFEFGQNLARFIKVVTKNQTIYPHQTEPGKSVSYKLYSLQSAELKTESTLHSVNTPKQYFISFLTAFFHGFKSVFYYLSIIFANFTHDQRNLAIARLKNHCRSRLINTLPPPLNG